MWVVPIYGSVFLLSGLYRGFWRFASLPDLVRIAKSVAIGATAVAVAAYLLQPHLPVPRSVILLSPLLLVVLNVLLGTNSLQMSTIVEAQSSGMVFECP